MRKASAKAFPRFAAASFGESKAFSPQRQADRLDADVVRLERESKDRPAGLRTNMLVALASAPEVAWLGVSPPDLKLSRELATQRGPRGQKAGVGAAECYVLAGGLSGWKAAGLPTKAGG